VRKRLNYFKYSVGLLVLHNNIVLLITVAAIFSSLLGPALSFDFAFATSEEKEEEEGDDNDGGGDDDRGCDLSYPEDCIPSPPPDLDCGDNGVPNNVKVLPPDPHRLDGNKDGVGCEGSSRGSRGGGGGGSSSDGDNGDNDGGNNDGSSTSTDECQGQADCFRGIVTEIVDGDTMDINNLRVRLALVNTPEGGESGYTEAIDFVESVCGVGTTALVDEDDGQKEGSFDRLIGLLYCGDDGINNKKSLNELLVERGYAVIYQDFCNTSEFSSASWVQRYGC
jgi:micrococcal nuclease